MVVITVVPNFIKTKNTVSSDPLTGHVEGRWNFFFFFFYHSFSIWFVSGFLQRENSVSCFYKVGAFKRGKIDVKFLPFSLARLWQYKIVSCPFEFKKNQVQPQKTAQCNDFISYTELKLMQEYFTTILKRLWCYWNVFSLFCLPHLYL